MGVVPDWHYHLFQSVWFFWVYTFSWETEWASFYSERIILKETHVDIGLETKVVLDFTKRKFPKVNVSRGKVNKLCNEKVWDPVGWLRRTQALSPNKTSLTEAEPKACVKMEGKHSLQEVVLASTLTLWHTYPLTCIHTNNSNKLNVFLIWHIDTPNKCNILTIFNWCRDYVTIIVLNEYEELKFWMDGLACQKQWYMFFSVCMCLWV